MTGTEMKAFESQVNFTLLGDIISAVIKAANAAYQQTEALFQRCIFLLQTEGDKSLQEKYGFMYLGELLERYEDRFGMPIEDRRAIALALGYTRDLTTDVMFVGSQRDNFIRTVKKCAQGDVYLTGALYLLHEGTNDGAVYEKLLTDTSYCKTEELIFAMSLFNDAEQALLRFNPQLPRLLGADRTLPMLENTEIFGWLVEAISPHKKMFKGADAAVLRALVSLPTSFVKEGSKPYACLATAGYTPLEIAYANIMAVCSRWTYSSLKSSGLAAEKIAVELFQIVLNGEDALPSSVFDQLTELYQKYKNFDVKCYEERKLSDVLKFCAHIGNPEVMAWFIGVESFYHPAVNSFDVLDPKWESLADTLEEKTYFRLFELSLTQEMSAAELRDRIDRYNALTQTDYLDSYLHTEGNRCFHLLVHAGIIDLWAAFQESIDEEGAVSSPEMLHYIKENIEGVRTSEAFQFFKKFIPQYGYDGLNTYFRGCSDGFNRHLWTEHYQDNKVSLSLDRGFLQDAPEDQLLLLHWAEEYFFTIKPPYYLGFVYAVLKDDLAASLLSVEDRRKLFDLYAPAPQSGLKGYEVECLKQLYLTPEELKAEQDAKDALKLAQKQKEVKERADRIQLEYKEIEKSFFRDIMKFVGKHRYNSEDMHTVPLIVRESLSKQLEKTDYTLTRRDFIFFLQVCEVLLEYGTLSWKEAQSYFLKIKEVIVDAPNHNQTA